MSTITATSPRVETVVTDETRKYLENDVERMVRSRQEISEMKERLWIVRHMDRILTSNRKRYLHLERAFMKRDMNNLRRRDASMTSMRPEQLRRERVLGKNRTSRSSTLRLEKPLTWNLRTSADEEKYREGKREGERRNVDHRGGCGDKENDKTLGKVSPRMSLDNCKAWREFDPREFVLPRRRVSEPWNRDKAQKSTRTVP